MAPRRSARHSAAKDNEAARESKRKGKKPVGETSEVRDAEVEAEAEDLPSLERTTARASQRRESRQTQRTGPTYGEFYNALMNLEFKSTKFADHGLLSELGIHHEVREIFTNMGMQTWFQMAESAHQERTCEFLASLQVTFHRAGKVVDAEDGHGFIEFTVAGAPYKITFTELNRIYGFEEGSSRNRKLSFEEQELAKLWFHIGDGQYIPGSIKSANIRNPAIRYAHKLLAHSFFARKETSYVNEEEMELLDLGLKPIYNRLDLGEHLQGDVGGAGLISILLRHMLSIRDKAISATPGKHPQLCIGGVITPILRAAEVELGKPTCRAEYIDAQYLVKCKFMKRSKDGFTYIHGSGKDELPLPNPLFTSLNRRQTFMFKADEISQLVQLNQPQQSSRRPEVTEPIYGSKRYNFTVDEDAGPATSIKNTKKQLQLLQRWNKWQDKAINKLVKSVKSLKSQVKDLTSKLGGASSGQSKEVPDTDAEDDEESEEPLVRRRSFQGTPSTSTPVEQPRASDFELRPRKRKARRSPSPYSSNPSLSVGSTSSSSTQF